MLVRLGEYHFVVLSKSIVIFSIPVLLIGCGGSNPEEGEVAPTEVAGPEGFLKIGSFSLEVSNLRTTKFLNGDKIPEAQTVDQWINAGEGRKPAWCYSTKKNSYGQQEVLYNYYAVVDSRGLVDKSKLLTPEVVKTMSKEASATTFQVMKKVHSEERNYSGNFYDLGLINWWVSSSDSNELNRAPVACWDPETKTLKLQEASKSNGFYVRTISNK